MGSVQDFILFCVWYESREIGGRGSSRFSCVTPAVKTFFSDIVAFRIPSNISDGALLRKQSGLNTMTASPKISYQTFNRTPNAGPIGGAVNVGCGWAAGTWKQIPSCRIVCKEVVEALSNYEK